MKALATAAVLGAALIAGCANNPALVRSDGDQAQRRMTLPPERAAACVARNAENSGSAIAGSPTTTVRAGQAAGTYELVIYSGVAYYVVADFAPDGAASFATIWTAARLASSAQVRLLAAFEGC